MASRGDQIHLDGTNTDKEPYTCQPGTSEHPGIYINTSLSLIGYGISRPQIRCSEGTNLAIDGSADGEATNVTFSGLFFNESSVNFQDSSANIEGCKFVASKQGVKFVIHTKIVSSLHISNSAFSRNRECFSVVVNSTKNPSQGIQAMFKVTNASFDGNVLSNERACISFTEMPYGNKSVSCDVTLENVTFFHNKFSSKGLVFLKMDNGNHNIHLQNVTFANNNPSSGRDVLTPSDDSEYIVHTSGVSIFIKSSNFISKAARSFNVSASNISLQIFNSSFVGHRVEGNGGVISLRGTDLCKLNVSGSSFVNTTGAQGGAINIECTSFSSVSFEGNVFTNTSAVSGKGGAVYIDSPGSRLNYSESSTKDCNGQIAKHLSQINITKCDFNNARSSASGGAVYISAFKASVRLCYSTFANCTAMDRGGGVFIKDSLSAKTKSGTSLLLSVQGSRFIGCNCRSTFMSHGGSLSVLYENQIQICINKSYFMSNYADFGGAMDIFPEKSQGACWVTIERSTFSDNTASVQGGAISMSGNSQSVLTLQTVTMENNRAEYVGGAVNVNSSFALNVHQSRFTNNTASSFSGGAIFVSKVSILEVEECHFDTNYVRDNGHGGAISVLFNLLKSATSLLITSTTFDNCWTGLGGGALYLGISSENVSLNVKGSLFMDNYSLKGQGGAIAIQLDLDIPKDRGCIKPPLAFHNGSDFPSWVYKGHLTFEDTKFERNAALSGGALHLTNGKAVFRNCSFINNFVSTLGGHIYTVAGSASLVVQDSLFKQTMNELFLLQMSYSMASFIHAESSGALRLHNTTMDKGPYDSDNPVIHVINGRLIDFGNDTLTKFLCPVGRQVKIVNFTAQEDRTQINKNPCMIKVTTLEFSCIACAVNSYSLQRGRAFGSRLAPGFKCLPCPFGANCSQNVIAEPNFWGFQEQATPPTLKFIMCPLGYCRPPQKTPFTEYSSCQGNRAGELCGKCNKSYTETLYSTNCRPSHECKDYWFWPVALIYVSIMALYFTFKPPIVPWIKRQILWFKEREPANEDNNFDKGYLKIVFYLYQAANLLLVSNSAQHILKTKFIEPFIGLFNFQQRFSPSGLICPFPGLTVVTKQLFSASHVFGTLFMIVIFYILRWGVQKFRGQEAPCVAPYIGGIIQTTLLGYATLASVSFNLLRCVPIGSEKRLIDDGNVVCFQWWQYILITFICTFIVPFVFVLLWGSFKVYSRTISVGKFLLACCLPLPSLLYWSYVSLFRKARSVTNQDSSPSQLSRDSVERVLYDCFKRPKDGRKLSLSWEGVMIGHRLILVVLKAFISDPMPRLLTMSFFCVLFLQHHQMTQPFRDGIANTAETFSLLSIVVLALINVFFSSFLSLAVPFNDHFSPWWNACQVVEIVILSVVPAVFGLVLIAAVLSQLCRLTVVICSFLCHLFWVCFSSFCRKQGDELRPLLA